MKYKYYHGTSVESANKILKEGFKNHDKNWVCSFDNNVYAWCTGDDYESNQLAIGNAQIAAAIQGSTENKVAVISFELDDSFDALPDISCSNMDGAYSIPVNQLKDIDLNVEYFPYNLYFRVFYLMGTNLDLLNCSDELKNNIKFLNKIDGANDVLLNLLDY